MPLFCAACTRGRGAIGRCLDSGAQGLVLTPLRRSFALVRLVRPSTSWSDGSLRDRIAIGRCLDSGARVGWLAQHHAHFNCNYGTTMVPLDKLFGTYEDGSKWDRYKDK